VGLIFIRILLTNQPTIMETTTLTQLTISSPSFEQEGEIPVRFTCDGNNMNPALAVGDLPEDTQALAIIMEDPDAPGGTYDHWLEWNIPVVDLIRENTNPGISGVNSGGKTGYHGPCPPSGSHRYYFHVFALDSALDLPGHSDRVTLEKAMKEHTLAYGTLMGRYERQR
jgi:Raf kinase inhibitor-like YbhB/YbcL family protein